MRFRKQLVFPIFIALGMSVLSACGNNNQNDMQDNGNATGTLPEGDNTTIDTAGTYMDTMDTDTLNRDTLQ